MNSCDQRLPKQEIIRRRDDFSVLFRQGKRWEGTFIRVHYLPSEGRHVGFSVPKRFGNAVHRNRIKRLMREVYRKHRWEIGNYSIIMFARGKARQASYHMIQEDFQSFLPEIVETNHS